MCLGRQVPVVVPGLPLRWLGLGRKPSITIIITIKTGREHLAGASLKDTDSNERDCSK